MSVGGNGDRGGEGVSVKAIVGIDVRVLVTIELVVGLAAGVGLKPLQDDSIAITRNKGINAFSKIFTFCLPVDA